VAGVGPPPETRWPVDAGHEPHHRTEGGLGPTLVVRRPGSAPDPDAVLPRGLASRGGEMKEKQHRGTRSRQLCGNGAGSDLSEHPSEGRASHHVEARGDDTVVGFEERTGAKAPPWRPGGVRSVPSKREANGNRGPGAEARKKRDVLRVVDDGEPGSTGQVVGRHGFISSWTKTSASSL